HISAYAERLLQGLDTIDWSEPIKEMQRNWIGKSIGAQFHFKIAPNNISTKDGATTPLGEDYKTANPKNWALLKEFGRTNRKNPTPEEDAIWQRVRNKKLGYKIRRQHTIQDFIADFACLSQKLVIEIDGEYHQGQKEYDQIRTEYLNAFGFRVIRFSNQEINENLEKVLEKIKYELSHTPFNSPSPEVRGLGGEAKTIEVFTTRLDTVYGVTYLALAPEHELVKKIVTDAQREEVMAYAEVASNRSERERMTEVKNITGAFTGAYAIHPFSGEKIPVWVADYVLAGYGTGAVMAVPSGDQRDYDFAKHFGLPITVINDAMVIDEKADPTWEGKIINSGFMNGLTPKEAIKRGIEELEKLGIGSGKINYRMRDAIFTRQRYWGEPLPVYFKDGIPYLMEESELPLVLPEVDKYLPTEDGEPPFARAENWTTAQGDAIEK
ncbi:MAG: DUF559 domain-containing protein, partial [Fulvivirga sp.]